MTLPSLVSWNRKTLLAGAFALLLEASVLSAPASDANSSPGPLQSPAATVELTESPLVMRMGKDEFRIAFGIMGVGSMPAGCHGQIRYRVNWKAQDGSTRWETREVAYAIAPHTARTITVDRQYFDTSEGAHTTEVVQVSVDEIVCYDDSHSVRP